MTNQLATGLSGQVAGIDAGAGQKYAKSQNTCRRRPRW